MTVSKEPQKVNELLEAALEYASRGWPVLPLHWPISGRCSCWEKNCINPAKHPLTPNGKDDATTSPATIREWWEKWPKANVGVVTGKESGLLVMDINPWNGADIFELPDDFINVPVVLTGGGGWHLYFRYPENGLKIPGTLPDFPGIDLKGTGGYVLAPPSLHISGENYKWGIGSRLHTLALPASLLEAIKSSSRFKLHVVREA